jgi:hypothetical protein
MATQITSLSNQKEKSAEGASRFSGVSLGDVANGGPHIQPAVSQAQTALFAPVHPCPTALRAFPPVGPICGPAPNAHAALASIRLPAAFADIAHGMPDRTAHRANCNRPFLFRSIHFLYSLKVKPICYALSSPPGSLRTSRSCRYAGFGDSVGGVRRAPAG